MSRAVAGVWGPPILQLEPKGWYTSPAAPGGKKLLPPESSELRVDLKYEPKKKGLLWHRTFDARFQGTYVFKNSTPITQTFYIEFIMPAGELSFSNPVFQLDGKPVAVEIGARTSVMDALALQPGAQTRLTIAYDCRGTDCWTYSFEGASRVRNFSLAMTTDFDEFDFPPGTASASSRKALHPGWEFAWNFPDVVAPGNIGMEMPNVLNPGPVAARITFFAPVSLLFFFTVLIIFAALRKAALHPMHFFFLAAACFAFQLLFAYLVDLIPITLAFAISAAVSVLLVSLYIGAIAGRALGGIAAMAQFAYVVLFSYSFFFEGMTGLTITIGAIVTLALLMGVTTRVNWETAASKPKPAAA